MRKLILALSAASLVVPTMMIPTAADAQRHKKHYKYREFKGRDGRLHCRKPDGTTGLVIGGVVGALAGRAVDTRGDRTAGTLGGAVLGGLAGREIDRGGSSKKHCR